MAQDTDVFHGMPIMGTLKSPGRYSPTGDGHPKQPQQYFPPCTTQASPPAMTNGQAAASSGCRTPSIPLSPQRLETFIPGDLPRPSQSPKPESTAPDYGGNGMAQQQLMLGDHALKQEFSPDDLRHGLKGMWPSRPSVSENCDEELYMLQRRASDNSPNYASSQPALLSQDNNGHDQTASQSRGWPANSQDAFQHPLPWGTNMFPSSQPSLNQSIYSPNRLDLLVDEGHLNNNSVPYDAGMVDFRRPFDGVDPNYLNCIPTTSAFPGYTSADNGPIILSPSISTPYYEAPPAMCQDREDTLPLSEADIDPEYKDNNWWRDEMLGGSPSSVDIPGSKVDEPYAQLIYRAFLSRPNKSMTLQEIYQWFRENTDKAKAEGKGWQNSIRHNLSMNGAFTKRNSKAPLNGNGDGMVSLDNTGVDGRKSTEWFLEPNFYAGVESTTRYRKGNSGSRSRGANSHPSRSRLGSDGHSGGGFSHARVSAGRKGGNVAAQNRKRLAQQQARQMDMGRGHAPRHLHMPGGGSFGGSAMPPYHPGGAYEGGGGDVYSYQHGGYSPAVVGGGGAPPLGSPFSPASYGGVPARQQMDMVGCNYFGSDDVGRDVHVKRSRTLGTEGEHNEPATPPGSGLLDPPRSAHEPFGGGSKHHHRELFPDMAGSFNPLNSFQHHVLGPMAGGGGLGQQQQQQPAYSYASVTGIYDPPAGSHQPPVFMDGDYSNLDSEDSLVNVMNFRLTE